MSQIIKNSTSGGAIPPSVPMEFTTDYNADFTATGMSVPLANIENVVGRTTPFSDDDGIATQANPNGDKNLIVLLTNRLFGGGSTAGALTLTLITFPLALVATSYRFEFQIAGREAVSGDSLGYTMFASAKTNGTVASIVETPYVDVDQDAPVLLAASIAFIASGNSVLLQVTGVAGTNITYKALGTYIQI